MDLKKTLKNKLEGSVSLADRDREKYLNDGGIFNILPNTVIKPKSSNDLKEIIQFIASKKNQDPSINITTCGAQTSYSGSSLSDSVILDTTKHFGRILKQSNKTVQVGSGVRIDILNKKISRNKKFVPCAPAANSRATIGGMLSTNSSNPLNLATGDISNFVIQLRVVLSDGIEYTIKPLTKKELDKKMAQENFEGQIYKKLFSLLERHHTRINNARPRVPRSNVGYNIWNIWMPNIQKFDLTKLFIGAEGTLGIITEATIKLEPIKKYKQIFFCEVDDEANFDEIITKIREIQPSQIIGFEYPDRKKIYRSLKDLSKQIGTGSIINLFVKTPISHNKYVLKVTFETQNKKELQKFDTKFKNICQELNVLQLPEPSLVDIFDILQKKFETREQCPFLSDIAIPLHHLPIFLNQLHQLIQQYNLPITISGDFGNGQIWFIPLKKMHKKKYKTFQILNREINRLAMRYNGMLSTEYADGMTGGLWYEELYGPTINRVFKKIKNILDPQDIFNSHKKTGASKSWNDEHISPPN